MKATQEDIGKRAVFKLTACNWPARKETRIIHKVKKDGGVIVSYAGYTKGFHVRPREIQEIIENG